MAPILPMGEPGSQAYRDWLNFRFASQVYLAASEILSPMMLDEMEEMVLDRLEDMDIVDYVMEFEDLLFDIYPMLFEYIVHQILYPRQ